MIRREMYLKKLEMYLGRKMVKIITGVRRCGKTTLMLQFIESLKAEGIPEETIFYVNFEGLIYSYFTGSENLRDMLVSYLQTVEGRHSYIFLDEVQCVEGWAQVAAELLNLFDCDVYVSSSNSSIFHEGYQRTLNYRYVRIDVYPLTFAEYLELNRDGGQLRAAAEQASPDAVPAAEGDADGTAYATDINALFRDYLQRGCMPGTYGLGAGADYREYLKNLYNAILLKDVVQCNRLRDISHLDRIMEYIFSHMGETFSPKGIRDYVRQSGITISVDTVYSFLDALTGAFLIYKVPRYDIKADRELETQEKYYICDMGMRNAVMGDEGASAEIMLESALCLELLTRGFRVYVGKQNQSQIDFMAVKGEDRTYLNSCCTVEDKETVKQKFGPLVRIRDNYFKMVLSLDPETKINKGGIINYPIVNFLSQG